MNADLRKMREVEAWGRLPDIYRCTQYHLKSGKNLHDSWESYIALYPRPYLIDSDGVPPHTSGEPL